MANENTTPTRLIVNNTGTKIDLYIPAIVSIALGAADAETAEDFADIFKVTALADRVIVDFAD